MENDLNITPDMINNLINMLKNSENPAPSEEKEEQNTNSINFQDIISNFSNNNNNSEQTNKNSNNSIDIDTIMKIKNIMEALNTKNDSRSNLLYSLKPYLRKGRQDKLDQYVNLMKISQVTNLFKKDKEEKN